MARRTQPEPSPADGPDDVDLERYWRWLSRWGLLSPKRPSEELRRRLDAKRAKLAAEDLPVAERVAEYERFLAELGVLEQASAFAGRFKEPRPPMGRPR